MNRRNTQKKKNLVCVIVMVRVHTRKKTDLVSVMVRVNTRKKSDYLLSYIILYYPTFLILAGSDALGCVTGKLYINNMCRKRIKRTSAREPFKKNYKKRTPTHKRCTGVSWSLRCTCGHFVG